MGYIHGVLYISIMAIYIVVNIGISKYYVCLTLYISYIDNYTLCEVTIPYIPSNTLSAVLLRIIRPMCL